MMRPSIICLMMMSSVPALAMNYEGHDDWMADSGPAAELMHHHPEAHPGPRRDCPVTHETAEKNPYEQIPLPHHNCPPRPEKAEPQR